MLFPVFCSGQLTLTQSSNSGSGSVSSSTSLFGLFFIRAFIGQLEKSVFHRKGPNNNKGIRLHAFSRLVNWALRGLSQHQLVRTCSLSSAACKIFLPPIVCPQWCPSVLRGRHLLHHHQAEPVRIKPPATQGRFLSIKPPSSLGQVVAPHAEGPSCIPGRGPPIPAPVLAYLKAPASVNENPKPTSPVQTADLWEISIFESKCFPFGRGRLHCKMAGHARRTPSGGQGQGQGQRSAHRGPSPNPSWWAKAGRSLVSWLIPGTSPVLCINYGPPRCAANSIEFLVGRPNLALDADPALSSAPSRRRNATILSLPRSRRQGRAGQ